MKGRVNRGKESDILLDSVFGKTEVRLRQVGNVKPVNIRCNHRHGDKIRIDLDGFYVLRIGRRWLGRGLNLLLLISALRSLGESRDRNHDPNDSREKKTGASHPHVLCFLLKDSNSSVVTCVARIRQTAR